MHVRRWRAGTRRPTLEQPVPDRLPGRRRRPAVGARISGSARRRGAYHAVRQSVARPRCHRVFDRPRTCNTLGPQAAARAGAVNLAEAALEPDGARRRRRRTASTAASASRAATVAGDRPGVGAGGGLHAATGSTRGPAGPVRGTGPTTCSFPPLSLSSLVVVLRGGRLLAPQATVDPTCPRRAERLELAALHTPYPLGV